MKMQRSRHCSAWGAVTAVVLTVVGFDVVLSSHADQTLPTATTSDAPKTNRSASISSPAPELENRLNALRAAAMPGEPLDEALGGRTLHGTPITPRVPECFPAESRDLFWQMDMVSAGKDAPLRPLNFDVDGDGKIDQHERNAIRGRNTWLLWAGGNEGFWNWLTQDGYGITDFLVLLDSRTRGARFKRAGLINQPGYRPNSDPTKRILGLYLDEPVEASTPNSDLPEGYRSQGHVMTPPPWDADARRAERPANHAGLELFEPGDRVLYENTLKKLYLMGDGVDYSVYGFPSGIVGLRLFLNPDFFGKGDGPAKARQYWTNQVLETHDRYYTDTTITKDPKLVRPFRVGMSCGFCHVGPHPLNPPKDPEAPDWANLSSNIGNQFWRPEAAFANLQDANSFLYHFLASQQPGTIDTSLVSSDHINNANTINAVFNINARLARAALNPTERQSAANVRLKSIEDPGLPVNGDNKDWRHTPRVLLDGSDSIGAFGALARVYLNIGTFYEEWLTCHNAIIGFRKQRPFATGVCQKNSVYWQTNERFRTDYLAAFFTMKYALARQNQSQPNEPAMISPSTDAHTSTQPMKLIEAKEPDAKTPSRAALAYLNLDTAEERRQGREVWLNNCAICHSSKQPAGFGLSFKRKQAGASWDTEPAPKDNNYVLPMDGADWPAFKRSPAYAKYKARLFGLVNQVGSLDGDPLTDNHPFWKDNYLATDIRVPITLVGTQSGRALASNAIEGNVWDNFSSLTYKELPAVGKIGFFNAINGKEESFDAPGGGRGYYRPATHISLWATAPFLHNNSLGVYLADPSIKGRLAQFSDAIRRMLWQDKRASRSLVLSEKEMAWLGPMKDSGDPNWPSGIVARPGDLRKDGGIAANDPGFIYRVPQDTSIEFPAGFTRPLVQGIVGSFLTSVLSVWLWVVLVLWFAFLAYRHQPRYVGITLLGLAVLVAVVLALTGMGGGGGGGSGALLMGAAGLLEHSSLQWWIIAVVFAVIGITFIQAKPDCAKPARWLLGLLLAGLVYLVGQATKSIWLTILAFILALALWLWWKPTLPAFSKVFFLALLLGSALIGYVANCFINGRAIATIPVANIKIGPINVKAGPVPRGTPVNLIMNMDPESPNMPRALVSMVLAMTEIKKQRLVGERAWGVFSQRAGQRLLEASKCPDFVMDRGHLFGETLDSDPLKNDQEKEALIAFLKTL